MPKMREATLPNFFVVGAGKAGTTSLHGYLSQHPEIYMSPVKEPCYFANEIRGGNMSAPFEHHLRRQSRLLHGILNDGAPAKPFGWIAHDFEDYQRLFRKVRNEKAIGEASAAYLWSASAAANIHATIPSAKIIMILRDPAERAYSQYLHQLSVGLTRCSFREHVRQCMQGGRAGDSQLSIYHPFLEAGLYSAQVKRYLDLFPPAQTRIYWYEESWRRIQTMLEDLLEFLGVDPGFQPDTSRRSLERRRPRWVGAHYWFKKLKLWYPLRALVPDMLRPGLRAAAFRQGKSLQMDRRDREYLIDYYREDILKLSGMLDRDLSLWLT
jgi:hypothetical protein